MAAPYNPETKNEDYLIRIALEDAANPGSFKSSPTIAAGDFKVSIDGGALTNLGTLPSVSPASSVLVLITLSASEMNGDVIAVVCIDQTVPKEWVDVVIPIQTTQTPSVNVTQISGTAATADRLEAWLNAFKTGSISAGATVSSIPTDITETNENHYKNMILSFTGGNLLGQSRRIQSFTASTSTFYLEPDTNQAAAQNDTFITVPIIVGGLDDNGRVDVGRILGSPPVTSVAGVVASHVTSMRLAVDAQIADRVFGRNIAGGSDGGRTLTEAVYLLRNRSEIAGGVLTVYGTDDTASSWTANVTTVAGNPISQIDPA